VEAKVGPVVYWGIEGAIAASIGDSGEGRLREVVVGELGRKGIVVGVGCVYG